MTKKVHAAKPYRRPHSNQLRIIGGTLKRSSIHFPATAGLRPTPDRVRETLFNWLAPYIQGAVCLDLFAGSGVLGLEAVSRGACSCTLIEQDSVVSQSIKQNVARLFAGQDHSHIVILQEDVLHWLGKAENLTGYTIVFIDPPYQAQLLPQILALIQKRHTALYHTAWFYLESSQPLSHQSLHHHVLQRLHPVKTAHYGQIYFGLYQATPLQDSGGAK